MASIARRMLWAAVAALSSCNPSVADYCAPGTPECTPGEGGAREAAADVEATADAGGCDPSEPPSEAGCVLDERSGVFVAPTGSDSSAGSRSAPFASVGHALDVAKAEGKRVYVCAGTYGEQLVVDVARDGASIFGGFDCASWTYATGNRVVLAAPAAGYALSLEGLQVGATLEDLEFDAQSPSTLGASSIVAFATGSKNVLLERVVLVAGSAATGMAGGPPSANPAAEPGSNWYGTPPNFPELNGANAADAGGGSATTCTCADQSTSTGGGGASPFDTPAPTAGLPLYGGDAGAGAPGMSAVSCGTGGTALNGANAPTVGPDTPSTVLGTCAADGWRPALGTRGSDGLPGQGGGGGGNGSLATGSGGGGGCGGCGGAGGQPGSGGGSSIALLSYQSSVTLVGCTLKAGAGGAGGAGGNGEEGQGGGSPGSGSGVGAGIGCGGGAGGAGAGGNGGQGGPGGLSLGVGYCGTAPTIDGTVVPQATNLAGITVGPPGSGGAVGAGGPTATNGTGQPGQPGGAGPDGVAMAVRSLP
jgi:hypothetical protein